MAVLRVGIETQPGIVQIAVLCAGCRDELLERVQAQRVNVRSWSRSYGAGGHCEFCVGEAKVEAL